MLGSLNEADDAVQEAWLRLSRSDADEIENLGGWLTTVVSRLVWDSLRSRSTRREEALDAAGDLSQLPTSSDNGIRNKRPSWPIQSARRC